jgi:predicted transcriptional regulator
MNRTEPTVYMRTLARAIEVAGSEENLARFLGSTRSEIQKWASGESNPPMPIFFAMVDVLAANALTPIALTNLPAARARRSPLYSELTSPSRP